MSKNKPASTSSSGKPPAADSSPKLHFPSVRTQLLFGRASTNYDAEGIPFNAPAGDCVMDLQTFFGPKAISTITKSGQIIFHSIGDSDVGTEEQEALARDVNNQNHELGASFMVRLGDVRHLRASFVDIVALYSNAAENAGIISNSKVGPQQKAWPRVRLTVIASARKTSARKAVVLAVHHPPYARGFQESGYGHPDSPEMLQDIDDCCTMAGILPDAVMAGEQKPGIETVSGAPPLTTETAKHVPQRR